MSYRSGRLFVANNERDRTLGVLIVYAHRRTSRRFTAQSCTLLLPHGPMVWGHMRRVNLQDLRRTHARSADLDASASVASINAALNEAMGQEVQTPRPVPSVKKCGWMYTYEAEMLKRWMGVRDGG